MGKIKESVEQEEIPAAEAESEPVLTNIAMGMCNVTGEGWSLVKIRYNPVTGEVGKIEKFFTAEIRPYVEEQFRLETIKEDIFNNGINPWRGR